MTSEHVTRSNVIQAPICISQLGHKPSKRHFGAAGPVFAVIFAGIFAPASAQELDTCSGYTVCPILNFQTVLVNDPSVRQINANIAAIEAATLDMILQGEYSTDPNAPDYTKSILGKVMIYDHNLSINATVACATCHTAQDGFTGGSSLFNQTVVSYAGSIGNRDSQRKPMAYNYAPFSPILSYRASTGDFVGGNFWDDRATGLVTGNPAADQALGPPLNPLEMANPDAACVVYHLSQSAYRSLFEIVWGGQSFAITWPSDTAQLCAQPADATTTASSAIIPLSSTDRDQAISTFHNMGLAMANYEAGPEVSPFSSKYDLAQRGQATFTQIEQDGQQLFTGQANCSQCHSLKGSTGTTNPMFSTTEPVFTDYTAVNLGIPQNTEIPYLTENAPDSFGYIANPAGPAYRDPGVGGFLAGSGNADWVALAPKFVGTFQVATVRNVAKKMAARFVKSHMHNGYFKNLIDIVHFYNTRDVLPPCDPSLGTAIGGDVGTTCWPAPEVPTNVNHTQTGNLGLTHEQELALWRSCAH
jgi:cytochrome c peroxidase